MFRRNVRLLYLVYCMKSYLLYHVKDLDGLRKFVMLVFLVFGINVHTQVP